jgi:hypothetical protein
MGYKIIWFMFFSFGLIALSGAYGILYSLGRLKNLPGVIYLSYLLGILQFICALFLLKIEVVSLFWRILILITSIIYLFLPPFWLLFIRKFH